MEVRMVHPENGATVVHDTGEVNRLKGFGWEVEVVEPVVVEKKTRRKKADVEAPVEEPVEVPAE